MIKSKIKIMSKSKKRSAIYLLAGLMIAITARAQDAPEDISAMLEPIRAAHAMPGMAAAAMKGGRLVAIGATGLRKANGKEPVTVDDKWHIGSCTKSMTSTLAAMLVEQGKIAWDTKVGATFAELRESIEPGWNEVTLEQLLAHRGGAPAEPPANLWRTAWATMGTPTEQRSRFVEGLLLRRPEKVGEFTYSNQGYAIAGAMIERVTGRAWEVLMRERIFSPLLMSSAGFGAAATVGKTDQPWGHTGEGLTLTPVPPGPKADNPPAIGPAGTVHCSVRDLVRYAGWHAREGRGAATLLKPPGFTKLHTPVGGEPHYSLGWAVADRPWGGKVLTHAGSNTMNYAVIWISPEKDAAFVAATNVAGEEATKACDEAIAALIGKVLK